MKITKTFAILLVSLLILPSLGAADMPMKYLHNKTLNLEFEKATTVTIVLHDPVNGTEAIAGRFTLGEGHHTLNLQRAGFYSIRTSSPVQPVQALPVIQTEKPKVDWIAARLREISQEKAQPTVATR